MARNKVDPVIVQQTEYKNAELIMCEYMNLKQIDNDELKWSDVSLQEFHNYVAKRIKDLDLYINSRYP